MHAEDAWIEPHVWDALPRLADWDALTLRIWVDGAWAAHQIEAAIGRWGHWVAATPGEGRSWLWAMMNRPNLFFPFQQAVAGAPWLLPDVEWPIYHEHFADIPPSTLDSAPPFFEQPLQYPRVWGLGLGSLQIGPWSGHDGTILAPREPGRLIFDTEPSDRSGHQGEIGCIKDDAGNACDCDDVRECGNAYPKARNADLTAGTSPWTHQPPHRI